MFISLLGFYKEMMDVVHINEKWFVLIKYGDSYYLAPDKDKPSCHMQHKKYVTKVMFMVAIACPCLLRLGVLFDGKIRAWVFAQQESTKQNSKHWSKGTIEWKHVSANKYKVRRHLLENVFSAIYCLWSVGYCH